MTHSSEKSDRKTDDCKNQGTDNIDVPAPADEAVGKPDPYHIKAMASKADMKQKRPHRQPQLGYPASGP